MSAEYRVVWKREGMPRHSSMSHASRESAERHLLLLEDRPTGWPSLIEARIETREVGEWRAA